jgi:hypothetical protein
MDKHKHKDTWVAGVELRSLRNSQEAVGCVEEVRGL